MGKLAIIISLAATMTLTAMLIGIQRTSYETTHVSANYEQEVLAKEIATSAINAAASKVRRDYDVTRPQYDSTAFKGGMFNASASGTAAGPVQLTATGTYGDASYTVQASLSRLSSMPSAVLIDSDTTEVNFSGSNFLISGRDTRPVDEDQEAPEGSGWGTNVGGIWTRTNDVMDTFTAPLVGDEADNVRGLEDTQNVVNASIPINIEQLYSEATSSADEVFDESQVFSNQTFGTASAPAIIVVHGDVTLTGTTLGYGMLVVDGNLETSGNAQWDGLVLVSGEGDMFVTHSENSRIFGSVVVHHEKGEVATDTTTTVTPPPADSTVTPTVDDDPGDGTVDFEITEDEIVPQECFNASATVLGAAISAGGAYDLMVTTEFNIGGSVFDPWGSLNLPVSSNVNDDQNPRTYMVPDDYPAGTPINVTGRSWTKLSHKSGNKNSQWSSYMTVDSNSGSANVMALRNGDQVPDISGFMNQSNIMYFVDPYVSNGLMSLDPNQVIYLFELGTTNLNSSAADFQDLVILVTLSEGTGCATSMNAAPPTDISIDTAPLAPTNDPALAATAPVFPELSGLRSAGLGAGFSSLGGNFTICHVSTNETMQVGFFSMISHLLHGDKNGACTEAADPESDDSEVDDDEGVDDSSTADSDSGNDDSVDDEEDDGGIHKVTICHIPPGNPSNAHTINVGEPAVEAHLDHGDYLGVCVDHSDTGSTDTGSTDTGSTDTGSTDTGSGTTGDDGTSTTTTVSSGPGALHYTMRDNAKVFYSTESLGRLSSRLPSLRSTSWIISHDQLGGKQHN